jgi:hypothetical protein
VLHSPVAAVSTPKKRPRRGRPPQAAAPQGEVRSRLRVHPEALLPAADAHGWTVLATPLRSEAWTDVERLQADQEHHSTVAPGLRGSKHPAALRPGCLEKPARLAAWAMLTVVGLLVDAVSQRQVRLDLRDPAQHSPGQKGPTAPPTAAVVCALFAPVTLGQCAVEQTTSRQVHGIRDHPLLVCAAVGIDPAWYQGAATRQNARPRTTPP